jgi:UDP-N-acetylglucosamine 2-epimerase (non-hydrolysing)/GDP/UDP-N,N'-diacetylbacillosamine 2-epimerase (hydrolysing)
VNLLKNVWVLVGNSSSGIHEAATYKLPVVNIGTRQQGRERAKNVIDVPYEKNKIYKAINKALYDKKFRDSLKTLINPYGQGKTAEKIVKVLKTVSLNGLVQKFFYE